VYALTPGEARTENELVTCTISLFTGKAIVLIDSGATHSFLLAFYTKRYNISVETLKVDVVVSTPISRGGTICMGGGRSIFKIYLKNM
jgi:hypothetical protein